MISPPGIHKAISNKPRRWDAFAPRGDRRRNLALKEGEKIVAAALFETHRSRFSTFAVIHDGPMCDYHDTEALTFFMDALKRHAKAKGASQLEITPNPRIGFATPMELLCRMTRTALPTIS